MKIYYHPTHVIPGEKRIIRPQSSLNRSKPIQPPQFRSASRDEVKPAVKYTQIKELKQVKEEAVIAGLTVLEKEVKREIRQVRSTPYSQKEPMNHEPIFIQDYEKSLVGVIYLSDNRKHQEDIRLGDTEIINNIYFRFDLFDGKYFLRAKAEFTEEGASRAKRYVKKQLQGRYTEIRSRDFKRKLMRSKQRINREIRQDRAYDFKIDGVDIHIVPRFKLEVFTSLSHGLEHQLAKIKRENDSPIIVLSRTNETMNSLFTTTFSNLSKAAYEVLYK